ADARKAVATRANGRTAVVNRNVVPVGERFANERRAFGIVGLEVRQRFIGQHHAPAEGVIRPVPLDHHDLVRGIAPLERNGKIEAAGAAAETYRAHGPTRLSLPIYYKPINSKLKAFFEKNAPRHQEGREIARFYCSLQSLA